MGELSKFDRDVLKAISSRPGLATYVIRNMLTWKRDTWGCGYWPNLGTPKVLRACRRLQKLGLIEEASSVYVVMKCWRPTPSSQESGR